MMHTPQRTDQPRKVVFLITKSNWGGAQRYVYDLATELQATWAVTVITSGNGALVERLRSERITVHVLESMHRDIRIRDEMRTFKALLTLLRALRPDVLHVNSSKAGGLGALAGRIVGIQKIVFTAHGWEFNAERPRWQKVAFLFLYWVTMLLAHTTIAVSEQVRADVQFLPCIRARISVIPLGIRMPALVTREKARERLIALHPALAQVPANRRWCGMVAELHPIKGHRYLFDALLRENLAQKYVVVCLGEGQLRVRLEELLRTNGLAGTIFLLGHVADADRYMRAFDTLVVASLSESAGYALCEAARAEVPVITTPVGYGGWLVKNKEHGIVVPCKDSFALASALTYSCENPAQAAVMAKNLHAKVANLLSLESTITQTLAVYGTSSTS